MEKATTVSSPEKIELFQAMTKTSGGNYIAVLSDDSTDRDGEIVSGEALQKVLHEDNGKTAILLNHENKIENLIGEWTNKRIETIEGHKSLVAEPKFYLSNPKAVMIKGLLDDGAQCGISIGAMVKNCETRKINGKSTNVFTELELLEASFVAIPSNRHGLAMAMAKKFGKKLSEETQMAEETTKTYSEEEYSAVLAEKAVSDERIVQLEKDLEEAKAEPEEVEEEVAEEAVEEPAEEVAEPEAEAEEAKEASVESDLSKEVSDLKEANKALNKEVETIKATPLYKSQFNTPEGDTEVEAPEASDLNKGLPIITR